MNNDSNDIITGDTPVFQVGFYQDETDEYTKGFLISYEEEDGSLSRFTYDGETTVLNANQESEAA